MAGIKGKGGKKGRSGRKSKAEEMGLAALLDKCVTVADRRACLVQLTMDCKSRDFHERHESRKLLLAYVYGKPKESVEHSGKHGDAFEVVVRHVTGPTSAAS